MLVEFSCHTQKILLIKCHVGDCTIQTAYSNAYGIFSRHDARLERA